MKDSFGYEKVERPDVTKGFYKCPFCKETGLTAAGVRQHFCPTLRAPGGKPMRLPVGQIERILAS